METKLSGRLAIVEQDDWLKPVEGAMTERYAHFCRRLSGIERTAGSLVDYANGYLYFGFQYDPVRRGWWFREWLPGAIDVYLFGDFNGWQRTELPLRRGAGGVWSIFLPDESFAGRLVHGSRVKILVHGRNGWLERIPAYIRRVVQDEQSKDFSGQLWAPAEPFDWNGDRFDISSLGSLYIYECHVGMSQEKEGVGTYAEFAGTVLPRIKEDGYNVVQLMAVAEHPYYGSFGYHVSNFFAPSSRFGTPEDLKALIKRAHELGLAVVMDLVQAHYVKNINEGLNELDGTDHHYSLPGPAGEQPYWDSKLFDYGKPEVEHFLLSNVKYWLDEFHFDGYRFDGVTSMIYTHHGYTEFDSRDKYFTDVNGDALAYLTLANKLVHDFRPGAVTIAEDVSGMPGMCAPVPDGGVGFDYRLGMAVPDFWIKLLKEVPDEEWNIWEMWHMMVDRLGTVKTVAYCESHDQALVGDKTLAFRLMDKQMYTDMNRSAENLVIDRGMALHKLIRLFTISLAGDAYLNFMGNEFGHPEWIDFPREGNGWSCKYARRQWDLVDNKNLAYHYMGDFDAEMLKVIKSVKDFQATPVQEIWHNDGDQVLAYGRKDLIFVFNFNPKQSFVDYGFLVSPGAYEVILNTDNVAFGGNGLADDSVVHFTIADPLYKKEKKEWLKLYIPARTAVVLRKKK